MGNEQLEVIILTFSQLALFPNASLPMLIKDEFYKKLFEDALKEGKLIAVGLGDRVTPPGMGKDITFLSPKKVMTAGRIESFEQLDDGSYFVMVEGVTKIELHDVVQEVPYLVCKARPLAEENLVSASEFPSSKGHFSELRTLLFEWLKQNNMEEVHKSSLRSRLYTKEQIVDALCTYLIHDKDLKQILLECSSMGERIRLLFELLMRHGPSFVENHYVAQRLRNFERLEYLDVATN